MVLVLFAVVVVVAGKRVQGCAANFEPEHTDKAAIAGWVRFRGPIRTSVREPGGQSEPGFRRLLFLSSATPGDTL